MLKDLTKAVASLRFRGAVGPMRPTQEAKLREMFEELDEDSSGSLDHDEVARGDIDASARSEQIVPHVEHTQASECKQVFAHP